MNCHDGADLRRRGRNPDFCLNLDENQLKSIVNAYLKTSGVQHRSDLLATISNIILINKNLNTIFFEREYAKDLILAVVNDSEIYNVDIVNLIPSYRIVFLTLCSTYVGSEEQNKIQTYLSNGLNMISNETLSPEDVTINSVIIEISKSLYAFIHRYQLRDGRTFLNMMNLFNKLRLSGFREIHQNLLQKTIEVLLISFEWFDITDTRYRSSVEEFFDNLIFWLKYLSAKCLGILQGNQKGQVKEDFSDFNSTLGLFGALLKNSFNSCDRSLYDNLIQKISKTEGFSEVFLKFLLKLDESVEYASNNKDVMLLSKTLILDVIYTLLGDIPVESRNQTFAKTVGIESARDYMSNNGITVPDLPDLQSYLEKTQGEKNEKISAYPELTESEKEAEAEKLFILFDRIENNPVFQGFKNPVREWQQSGKFEDL